MSDEQVNALNAEATEQAAQVAQDTASAAPNAGETASQAEAPVSGENATPESDASDQQKRAKTFSQEEVDALIAKRLAREERKRQREAQQMQRPAETPPAEAPAAPAGKPAPENFQTTEAYLEALTDWKAKQIVSEQLTDWEQKQREARARNAAQAAQAEYQRREDAARDKHEDFDDVVYNPALPITDHMAFAIQHSEVGPELAYHLGSHPDETARIARLHPLAQAKELGKLEAKLASAPAPATPAKPSAAPAPIAPIGGKQTPAKVYDTTDPRSIKSMTTSEWIAAERRRQEEKWKAQHR